MSAFTSCTVNLYDKINTKYRISHIFTKDFFFYLLPCQAKLYFLNLPDYNNWEQIYQWWPLMRKKEISCTVIKLSHLQWFWLFLFHFQVLSFCHNYCLDYLVQVLKSHFQICTLKAWQIISPVVALFAPLPFTMQLIRRFARDPFMHSPWVEVRSSERRQPNCLPWGRTKLRSQACQLPPGVGTPKHLGCRQHTHAHTYSHMLSEEQWHYGYVWHMCSHNHTPRQLWFPQIAALSLQREDLSEALFNTDVKMRAARHGGRRMRSIFEMFISCCLWLTGRQALSLTLHVWQNLAWMIKW